MAALILTFIDHKSTNNNLEQFVKNNSGCISIDPEKGSKIIVSNAATKLYKNTLCGVAGATIVFIVNNAVGYTIIFNGEVESEFLNEFLSTFKFL